MGGTSNSAESILHNGETGLDWEFTAAPSQDITIVLVGRTGNGKSATGNSIVGRRVFLSKSSSRAITSTCETSSTTLADGRRINVVDTPGLFDPTTSSDVIGREIVKCIDFAKEGIHGILMVLSTRNRFTAEEMATLESLQALFGPKVVNYMTVVFTGGDELEENNEDLNVYLANAPSSLLDFLKKCSNRTLLFDNKTKDKHKKEAQRSQLLEMVDQILAENNGTPFSNELFQQAKDRALKFSEQTYHLSSLQGYPREELKQLKIEMEIAQAEQLRYVAEMVEEKIRICTARLEEQLVLEQQARLQIEQQAMAAKAQSEEDMKKLRNLLEEAHREREILHQKLNEVKSKCSIL